MPALQLDPNTMKQLFPDAKEGDTFEASISGTFKNGPNGLEPDISDVEGHPVGAPASDEGAAEDGSPDEGMSDQSPDGSPTGAAPAPVAPGAPSPADDMKAKLMELRKGIVGKYA